MTDATSNSPSPDASARLELLGQVSGVEACRFVTGRTKFVVGSGAGCDLPLSDPLVPAKAFRLALEPADEARTAEKVWIIEPLPGARLCVNGHIVHHRERLRPGDTIAIGCHRLAFKTGAVNARECRLTVDVADLCQQLLAGGELSPDVLAASTSHRDRLRGQRALLAGAGLAAVLALAMFLTPRDDAPELGGPVSVTLATEQERIPSAGAVRSLETVDRQNSAEAIATEVPVALNQPETDVVAELSATPMNTFDLGPPSPEPSQLSRVVDNAGPKLGQLEVVAPSTQAVQFTRELAKLGTTTAARRLAVSDDVRAHESEGLGQANVQTDKALAATAGSTAAGELADSQTSAPQMTRVVSDAGPGLGTLAVAAPSGGAQSLAREAGKLGATTAGRRVAVGGGKPVAGGETLGQANMKTDKGLLASAVSTRYAREVTDRAATKPLGKLDAGRAENLAALTYKASPVTFQDFQGHRIPIARVPEQLSSISAPKMGLELDGIVSDEEAAMSFKTGRFRVHGPGNPPEASPATYCYVHKRQVDGKDYLYVGFTCTDPNVGALVLNQTATAQICFDDSIEIFVDVNADRVDYHHIIVNARGNAYSEYCRNGDEGINGKGLAWNANLIVKSAVLADRKGWSVEILIPYASFPQMPTKGAEIPFNVCRNFRGQKSTEPLQNWFAVYEASMNYHHPKLFGRLIWP